MSRIYLARQPIFDRELSVYGYELLYRNGDANHAWVEGFDGDQATSDVIVNSFIEMGLDNIVGPNKAFLNFTKNSLINHNELPSNEDKIVIEILENIEPEAHIIESVRKLRNAGHLIAMDDFIYNEKYLPLLRLAHIVKIDLMQLSQQQLIEHVDILKPMGVKLLAEKVETYKEYQLCRELGFDYFQGYFLSKPKILSSNKIAGNQVLALQLMAKVYEFNVQIEDLAEIIQKDLGLSLKLLRYINSAYFGLVSKVNSIRQATAYLGLDHMKYWTGIVVLSEMTRKPPALMALALCRAKMCELLEPSGDAQRRNYYFTLGLFSTLDAFLDMPLIEVVKALPLREDFLEALLHHSGHSGETLSQVLAYERSDWKKAEKGPCRSQQLSVAYHEAIAWADKTSEELQLLDH